MTTQRPPWPDLDRSASVRVSTALETVVVSVVVGMLSGPTWYVSQPNVIERALGITFEAKVRDAKAKAQREAERMNRAMKLAEQAAA